MTKTFDPYYRWLGIPPREQPAHLYRLLGLELFESDPDVIDSMASRHIEYLQEINDGPHLQRAQQLLNELTAARRTLLAAEKKAVYDATLKATLRSERTPPVAAPPRPPVSKGQFDPSPAVTKTATERLSRDNAGNRHDAGKPRAKSSRRRSAPKQENVLQLAAHKRRMLLAACGLACLGILLAGGFWLGSRDGQRDELVRSDTDPSVAESSADRERFVDRQPNPRQEPTTTAITPATTPATTPAITPEVREPGSDASVPQSPSGDGLLQEDSNQAQPGDTQTASEAVQPTIPTAVLAPVPKDDLLLWLDAADAQTIRLSDDRQVRHWHDKSDNQLRASVEPDGSGLELATAVLSDQSAVRFSGADWLKIDRTLDLLQGLAEYTFICVARGVSGTLLSNGTGDEDPCSFAFSPGVTGFRIGGREYDATSESPVEFHVRSLVVDSESVRWFVDSQPAGSFDTPPPVIDKVNVLRIGCSYRNRRGAESIFRGELAELMIYGRALADDQRQELEAAARAKWLCGSVAAFPFDVPAADADVDIADADDRQNDVVAKTDGAESTETAETDGEASHVKTSPSGDTESIRHRQEFIALRPDQMEASAGTTFHLREDGALLADGQNERDETYRISFQADIPGMTAILLEALPDDSLPGKGPGLGRSGIFSLAEFSATVKARGESGPGRVVKFWQTRADDDSQAALSNDGDPATRWTVRRRAERVPVVYVANQPFGDPGGSLLELTLVQRENLGCFRVSATSADEPWKLPIPTESRENDDDDDDDDGFSLFVNLGGDTWQEPGGRRWLESKSFTGESFGHEGGQSVKTDEAPNALLGTARRGIVAFRAAVEPGDYEVQLIFSEHWTSEPRDRLFSVFIEQRPALPPRLGIGFGQPYIHQIPRLRVTESPLDIDFLPAREGAKTILNGVSIRRLK